VGRRKVGKLPNIEQGRSIVEFKMYRVIPAEMYRLVPEHMYQEFVEQSKRGGLEGLEEWIKAHKETIDSALQGIGVIGKLWIEARRL
jgi:hypothetical protein